MTGDSPSPRAADRFVRALAGVLLAVIGISMAASLRPREIARRWRLLDRSLSGAPISAGEGTRFWFDPAYAEFLEDLRRRVPPDATVAVLVPRVPDTYAYAAVYELAPRRVVDGARVSEADYVATYRTEPRPMGDPIAQGTLWRR